MTAAASPGSVRSADGAARHDAGVVRSASGLLGEANLAGVLSPADVHVAARLGALVGEHDERVLLAAALAVRAVRQGSVCVDLRGVADAVVLDEEVGDGEGGEGVGGGGAEGEERRGRPVGWPDADGWLAACAVSPLVAVGWEAPGDRPLRLAGDLLYLERHAADERVVAGEIDRRLAAGPLRVDDARARAALDRELADPAAEQQRRAVETVLRSRLTVVTGGPGTGKTATVSRLLAVLADQPGPPRVALAAPTGKAATRLHPQATTLHRLLGSLPGVRGRFRHDRHQRLPHDVVVVDETSMVPLSLMARLLEAVREDARVVLVGDPDQLSSVEAGAVLRDVVDRPPPAGAVGDHVVGLTRVFRAVPRLQRLAEAIRGGDPESVLALLRSGQGPDPGPAGSGSVELVEIDVAEPDAAARLPGLRADVAEHGRAVVAAAAEGRATEALAAAGRHRLLCARRTGPYGVERWSQQVEQWVQGATPAGTPGRRRAGAGSWSVGTPVIVTANDYDVGLFNGDTGVVLADVGTGDAGPGPGATVAAFGEAGPVRRVHPARVAHLRSARALTVHRAQGSEFDAVTVVLPDPASPLLTRELLYTAVTRARSGVRVVGTAEAVATAVTRRVARASGLRTRRVPSGDPSTEARTWPAAAEVARDRGLLPPR